MNNPLVLVLALVFVPSMRTGCDGVPSGTATQFHLSTDQGTFEDRFAAVCRIGERGGDGTLIAPEWVLTAAHVASGMDQRLGRDLRVHFDDGRSFAIAGIYLHPQFAPMGVHDIALIKLEGPVVGVDPVPCYDGDDELGSPIILAGHGDRRQPDGGWIRDGRLRTFTNRIDGIDPFEITFDLDAPGPDATENEGTSGPGDSGGPAFLATREGLVVAGISSKGEPGRDGPCSYGAVEHFVRVSRYHAWITAVMSDPAGHPTLKRQEVGLASIPGQGRHAATDPMTLLEGSARGRAVRILLDALASGERSGITAAVASTYSRAALERRSAETIVQSMPALVAQLSGAQAMGIIAQTNERISIRMGRSGEAYVLDLFFLPDDSIEQMAFGRLG